MPAPQGAGLISKPRQEIKFTGVCTNRADPRDRFGNKIVSPDGTEKHVHSIEKYAFGWRVLHWAIAALVLTTIPIGLAMASRADANIFDAITNTFYAMHKAIGFTVLSFMVLRLMVKIGIGAPAYPASMPRRLVVAAKSVHHLIYILLFVTPILGWAGVTAYPALVIAGGISLPPLPLVPQNEALAERLFAVHGFLAFTLALLLIGHVGAALRHLLIEKDGVFGRMWFGK
jgi:cytochrome b561